LNVTLGTCCNIEDEAHHNVAIVLNNVSLGLGVVTTAINCIISVFDLTESKLPWSSGREGA
jgi:hypothetical protein